MIISISKDTWVISDTHFGHDNIIDYCGRPIDHEGRMIAAWEELVQPKDQVLHLGDVWFGRGSDAEYWSEVISTLPGRKFLVLGNHDRSNTHYYRDAGFTIIKPFVADNIAFSHYPMHDRDGEVVIGKPVKPIKPKYFPPADKTWHTNIHGHVHHNKPAERISGGKRYLNVSVEVVDYKPVRIGDICAIEQSLVCF